MEVSEESLLWRGFFFYGVGIKGVEGWVPAFARTTRGARFFGSAPVHSGWHLIVVWDGRFANRPYGLGVGSYLWVSKGLGPRIREDKGWGVREIATPILAFPYRGGMGPRPRLHEGRLFARTTRGRWS